VLERFTAKGGETAELAFAILVERHGPMALRQYLNDQFVAQLLGGAGPLGGKPAPQGKSEPLMHEFNSVLTFADDLQPQPQDWLASRCHAARRQGRAPGHRRGESILRALLAAQSAPALHRRTDARSAVHFTVDLDGKNRRRILPTGNGNASACWSPDGQRIAVAISGSKPGPKFLDGAH
jgi:hypothetical protein